MTTGASRFLHGAPTSAAGATLAGVTTGRGEKISAAKKGKPLVARGPNEITRQEAVRETGLSAKVLLEGADRHLRLERREDDRPGLRHRRLPHANGGEVILFDRDELAKDLARLRCAYPGCSNHAPGASGRCGKHAARVKYPTVELVCAYELCPREGKPFTRAGSVHLGHAERGDEHTFCSVDCRFACNGLPASAHAPFTADSANGRYTILGPLFDEERAELGLALTVHQVAAATHTPTATIRTHAPELGGQVVEIDGAQQLAFPADAPECWAGRPRRRWLATPEGARWLAGSFIKGRHGHDASVKAFGRVASVIAAGKAAAGEGKKAGRPSELDEQGVARVRDMAARGKSQRAIAQALRVSRKVVRNVLG